MRTWVLWHFFVQGSSKIGISLLIVSQKLGDINFRLRGPQKHSVTNNQQ
jgi:hypothetical protein